MFTQDQLDKLKEALISGATSISMDGRTISFRSQDDLRSLIAEIERALASEEETLQPRKTNYQSKFRKS